MTMLDENLRRLFRECTPPRLSDDDLDRALARFEGRRRPAPFHARGIAAAAAVLLLAAVAFWLVPAAPNQAPAQAAPEDVDRLIKELGNAETREKARARLLAIGPDALKALERALYHDDPEVRVQSQAVAKAVRRLADLEVPLAFTRAAVKIVRARWTARDFTDFEQTVLDAFQPEPPTAVHYVPRKTIGNEFDAIVDQKDWPGKKDVLTAELVAALDRNDGILFVDNTGDPTDLSPNLLFTLPDKVGWSAYVVVDLPSFKDPANALRAASTAVEEDVWAFFRGSTLTPRPEGGLEIVAADPKNPLARLFKKGDVIHTLNRVPVTAVKDLAPLSHPGKYLLRMSREGKLFTWELQTLLRAVRRLSPKSVEEARKLLEAADALWAQNDPKALDLYVDVMNRYGGTDLLDRERRFQVLDRIATLNEKKK